MTRKSLRTGAILESDSVWFERDRAGRRPQNAPPQSRAAGDIFFARPSEVGEHLGLGALACGRVVAPLRVEVIALHRPPREKES
jgi:hypothetical protein